MVFLHTSVNQTYLFLVINGWYCLAVTGILIGMSVGLVVSANLTIYSVQLFYIEIVSYISMSQTYLFLIINEWYSFAVAWCPHGRIMRPQSPFDDIFITFFCGCCIFCSVGLHLLRGDVCPMWFRVIAQPALWWVGSWKWRWCVIWCGRTLLFT